MEPDAKVAAISRSPKHEDWLAVIDLGFSALRRAGLCLDRKYGVDDALGLEWEKF